MPYKVIVNENSNHADETEAYELGEFDSCEAALAACRKIVDQDLMELSRSGISGDDLYDQYKAFGRDPYIVSSEPDCKFSAWDYAKDQSTRITSPPPLAEWFLVSFDHDRIILDVTPPGRGRWVSQIEWQTISRICFKTGDAFTPDEIYIFTSTRAESHLIPTEAAGGLDLWNEIIRRGLFDPELAIKAASTQNELFCVPDV